MSDLLALVAGYFAFMHFRLHVAHRFLGPRLPYHPSGMQETDIPFALFMLFAACLFGVILKRVRIGSRNPSGIWTTRPGRWLIGRFAGATVFLLWSGAIFGATVPAVGYNPWLALPAAVLAWLSLTHAKIFLGKASRPVRRMLAARHFGKGGSSRFAGILDEWANPWKEGAILLGYSMYDKRWPVGIKDDRHLITIATTRAGKGVAGLIATLLRWLGSAVVVDPKGELAAITARARGLGSARVKKFLGQDVFILDPFETLKNLGLESASLNPLDELDPTAIDYVERVRALVDAFVVPSNNQQNFWDNSCSTLLSGAIDLVKRSDIFKNSQRHLGMVRKVILEGILTYEKQIMAIGGLAESSVGQLKLGGGNSSRDIVSTVLSHTAWLDSDAAPNVLRKSTFSMDALRNGRTTIYLVIPGGYLAEHKRFVRMFLNQAISALEGQQQAEHDTLFMIDELFQLGTMDKLANAVPYMAGYRLKLWTVIHNIGQLKQLYAANWESFLANAAQWQVFAMNDKSTSEYLSDWQGKRVIWRREGTGKWTPAQVAPLREPAELRKETSRESQVCAVFVEGHDTFLLHRRRYYETFSDDYYDDNPFQAPHVGWRDRARGKWGEGRAAAAGYVAAFRGFVQTMSRWMSEALGRKES